MNQYVSLFTPKIRLGKISQSKLSTFEKKKRLQRLYTFLIYTGICSMKIFMELILEKNQFR